ncbi:MAG: hypothetical protein M0R80_01580 [Proteobacteria bacterium]|jgi:hypothetical protein|nr:hypothetical protein [Pseudomonadota bacterium]
MEFRQFVENYEKDIKETLGKLPKKYQKLIHGYKFKFQSGNTLSGDNDHIGVMDEKKKTITIAAPWNYGREFTFLHELGHRLWETLPSELKNEWAKMVKQTKMTHKDRQNPEELFCHGFANQYAKHKHVMFTHPEWEKFIKKLS